MNVFAFLSLLACILSIIVGYSVYSIDKKKTLNIVFSIFAFLLAFWCFTEFGVRGADSLASAFFWMKMEFVWPFATALTLHFALIFSEKIRSIKEEWVFGLLLYVPAAIFSLIYLATDLITPGVVEVYWGYALLPGDSWVVVLSDIWAFSLTFTGIGLCFNYFLKNKGLKRKQAKCVSLGFFVPVFIALITYGVFPFWHLDFPEMTTISTVILCLMVGHAIRKYQLFSLTPAAAAETILSTMTDPLLLTDRDGKAVRANQAFIEFMDLSSKNIQQKSLREILTKSNFMEYTDFPETSNFHHLDLELKKWSGDEKFVQLSCSDILDSKGETVGLLYFLHDVTELKKIQFLLLKSERFAAIGELAGMLGHDLRNPLTGIKNAIYFLKKKGKTLPESKIQEFYLLIDMCIDHSNKIINNLLDYSKEVNLTLEENTIRDLLNESIYMITIPERIEFTNLTSEKLMINVDKEKIKRVFLNLINNAIDAIPDNGKLTIVDREADGNIEISFIDTGTGIPSEVLPNIFSPLFTTKAQGTGLGLAACKRIIEAHKGEITVETEINKGSTFKVILPHIETAKT